ncbi:t-SNARE [Lineolata rhizophorae]|uniref:t-SNARE n=1 Tax=Lineolata rhizophorae TaxID=578093 RepID=A0A6A6PEE3_9PEZI|nr:t-SNARE [Lineolata rhizophorae]
MQQAPQQPTSAPMSTADFLARVEAVQNDIRQVGDNISSIGTMHQRLLSSPDQTSTAQLENLVTQTQILNGRIKDTVRFLEADALRSPNDRTKDAQFRSLKTSFKNKLQDYQEEERAYRQRYQDQIARQYRIVNPDATEEEVREAADADWGNEGVFQSALKSNRTGHANSVLGAVRARHNDIQRINKTLEELAQLFEAMNEAVVLQGEQVDQVADAGQKTLEHTEQGNVELTKGVEHARRARKLKWWTLAVVVAIICILALILGLYFGLQNNGNGNGGGNNP